MARYQKRRVVLTHRRQKLILEIEHGHVYESGIGPGIIGHPLYDEKKEVALLQRLIRRAKVKGFTIVEDSGLAAKKPATKTKIADPKIARWVEDVDEAIQMWRDDEYDNHKDAILDARSLLAKPPKDQTTRVARLTKMLAKATKELAALAADDPDIAEYARGLIHARPKRAKRKSSKTKR